MSNREMIKLSSVGVRPSVCKEFLLVCNKQQYYCAMIIGATVNNIVHNIVGVKLSIR